MKLPSRSRKRALGQKRDAIATDGPMTEREMARVQAWSKELPEDRPAPAPAQVPAVASDLDAALAAPYRNPPHVEVQAIAAELARASATAADAPPVRVKSLSEDVAQAFDPPTTKKDAA